MWLGRESDSEMKEEEAQRGREEKKRRRKERKERCFAPPSLFLFSLFSAFPWTYPIAPTPSPYLHKMPIHPPSAREREKKKRKGERNSA